MSLIFSIGLHSFLFVLLLFLASEKLSPEVKAELELSVSGLTTSSDKVSKTKALANSVPASVAKSDQSPSPSESKNSQPQEPSAEVSSASSDVTAGTASEGPDDLSQIGPVADAGTLTKLPKVIKEHKATYPTEAKSKKIEGPVVLDIVIDRKGQVRDVTFISGPGNGLNESAMDAMTKFQFSPALKDQTPVAVKIRYVYRFKLGFN